MDFNKFKDQFHESWHNKIQPFIESEACDNIYKFLKHESKRGKTIAPLSCNVYKCFKATPLDDVKVIIMGMCPYHSMKHGEPVADGLLMGCSNTGELQPSLQQFYGGIERELYEGLSLETFKSANVSYLASQGVLMLNAALTTEINKAGSHIDLWEPFTKYLLEEVLAYTGAPIIFLGKDAAKYQKYVQPMSWSFAVSHPASASYKGAEWDTEGVFGKVNKILKGNNNFHIDWLEKLPF